MSAEVRSAYSLLMQVVQIVPLSGKISKDRGLKNLPKREHHLHQDLTRGDMDFNIPGNHEVLWSSVLLSFRALELCIVASLLLMIILTQASCGEYLLHGKSSRSKAPLEPRQGPKCPRSPSQTVNPPPAGQRSTPDFMSCQNSKSVEARSLCAKCV